MGRDCKAMEAIDMEVKDMNRKHKEVKDMSQVNLTPLSAVVDEVWGEKGSPRREDVYKRQAGNVSKAKRCYLLFPLQQPLFSTGLEEAMSWRSVVHCCKGLSLIHISRWSKRSRASSARNRA